MGDKIRELREGLGIDQAELAKRAVLSDGYISLLETGQRHASDKSVRKLAKALHTTARELYAAAGITDSLSREQIVQAIKEASIGDLLTIKYGETDQHLEAIIERTLGK